MPIHSFASFHQTIVDSSSTNQLNTNDFVQKEKLVVLYEQLQSQEHGRVCRHPTRNKQPAKYETGKYKEFNCLFKLCSYYDDC